MDGILIVTTDQDLFQEMAEMLQQARLKVGPRAEPVSLETDRSVPWPLAVVDLDDRGIDKRFFSNLARSNPDLVVIGVSARAYHPELKEAMSGCIRACLSKPVDRDDFVYLVKGLSNSIGSSD